jgi:membrane-bound ClpP family serine protease
MGKEGIMTEEKKGHFLDLKIPLGGLLTFYGLILIVFGLLSKKEIYEKSLGININLVWGLLVLFVGALLILAALAKPRQRRLKRGRVPGSAG